MGLALQRQASGMTAGGRATACFLGVGCGGGGGGGQLLASFPSLCCWVLPLLHLLHLKINEFRSATRPSSIHCRLAEH